MLKDVRSRERLLDEVTSTCTGRSTTSRPRSRRLLRQLHDPHVALAGRKVLVVDDDIRNIFAMTSVLERYDMRVLSAENGQAPRSRPSKREPEVDVVLMDIMMPGMDGHDTMRAIRSDRALPARSRSSRSPRRR